MAKGRQHGQHPAMVVTLVVQTELAEDVRDVALDRLDRDEVDEVGAA
jgi:hypothetical protein